ncbi:hypothetical protein HKX48_006534 [Thoreauomyces humboldtii]|nr:hypothetical protein HKX48_006534 [Thoreauomyces humboldtii]
MKLALSTIVLATVVSAQSFNTTLPAACSTGAGTAVLAAFPSCGLTEALPLLNVTTTAALMSGLNTLINSSTFVPAMCSTACTTALTAAAGTIETACGSSPILSSFTIGGQTLDQSVGTMNLTSADLMMLKGIEALDAADLINSLAYLRQALCVMDNKAYCIQTLNKATNGNLLATFDSSSTTCTPCAKKFSDAAKNTTMLPTVLLPSVQNVTMMTTALLANCSAASIAATVDGTTATTAGSSSSAGQVAVGSLAALGAAFAALLV